MRKVLYILGQLTDEDADWLAAVGARRRVPADVDMIREGELIDSLYVVLDGVLAVRAKGAGEIARLASGEVVGEMSFIDARPPSATVTAVSDAVVLAVPRPELIRKLERDAAFAARFYRALAMFLSDRLRGSRSGLGYGRVEASEASDPGDTGELSPDFLDSVHLGGARFDRMRKRVLAGG